MKTAAVTRDRLLDLRERRFGWDGKTKIRSLADAAKFVESVGVCMLWPVNGLDLPSLLEARRGHQGWEEGWDKDAEATWEWKDQMAAKGRGFYGKLLRGKGTLLAADCLVDFLALAGDRTKPDGFRKQKLPPEARAVADVLLDRGQMPSKALRAAAAAKLGVKPDVAKRGMEWLDGELWIVRCGTVREQGAAWESARYDLLPRVFGAAAKEAKGLSAGEARRRAADRIFRTWVVSHPKILARALGWSTSVAREVCGELIVKESLAPTDSAFGFPEGSLRTTALD